LSASSGSRASLRVVALGGVFLALLATRALAARAGAIETAGVALYLAAFIAWPGCAAWSKIASNPGDALQRLGMGLALGVVLQGAVFFGLHLFRLEPWFVLHPLLGFAFLRRDRSRATASVEPAIPRAALLALAVFAAVAVLRAPLVPPDSWWRSQNLDLEFHAGNAAEFLHHWPLRDPRVAGLPLNYHFGSYALLAGASTMFGIPVADLVMTHLAAFAPLLLVLQVFNAGRALQGSAWSGVIAAALIALHVDLGAGLADLGIAGADEFRVQSYLAAGIWSSPSTSLGLVLFSSLCAVVFEMLRGPTSWREAVSSGAFAVAASAVKGSVMPVAVGGLGLALLVGLLRGITRDRLMRCFAWIAIVSAPMTLRLMLGEGSYATAMFRWAPMRAMEAKGAYPRIASWIASPNESTPAWLELVLAPLWFLVFLGPAAIGAVLAFVDGWRRRDPARLWLAGCCAVGLGLALTLAADGYSQLFFAYTAQIGLAIAAGDGCARVAELGSRAIATRTEPGSRMRAVRIGALVLFCAPFALASIGALKAACAYILAPRIGEPREAALAREGFAWLRSHTDAGAIVVARHDAMLVSCFAERRSLHETERYTPRYHDGRWIKVDGEWILGPVKRAAETSTRRLRDELFSEPTTAALDQLRAIAPDASEVYVLCDAIKNVRNAEGAFDLRAVPSPACAPLAESRLLEKVFENAVVAIYRAKLR
jgi:hypothetical protein